MGVAIQPKQADISEIASTFPVGRIMNDSVSAKITPIIDAMNRGIKEYEPGNVTVNQFREILSAGNKGLDVIAEVANYHAERQKMYDNLFQGRKDFDFDYTLL